MVSREGRDACGKSCLGPRLRRRDAYGENEHKVINEKGKLGNYPLTLRGDKTLKTGVSLEVLQKNMELAFSSIFFLELIVFGNVEWSCKNRSGAIPTPA